jgi:hypothetical protein
MQHKYDKKHKKRFNMKKYNISLFLRNLLTFLLFLSIFSSCGEKKWEKAAKSVYRAYFGEKNGYKVWIVDGAKIREEIFNEFIYGGNPQRYPFVPEGEIWIDNSISAEEYSTTLSHEINECNLMAKFGMTYFDAHDSSLMVELKMRREFESLSRLHESELKEVIPIDFDSTQEIEDIPEKIKLRDIYRIPYDERGGLKIWIVDGYSVRKNIYPDFGFSGNGLAYQFIQPDEIWIDGSVTCEEIEYSIALEVKERELMKKGMIYDDAYTEAIKVSDNLRKINSGLIKSHKEIQIPKQLYRDTGVVVK